MIALDTNVLSELLRSTPAPQVVAWVDAQDARVVTLTSITVAELRYGVARLPEGARRDLLATAVEGLLLEDFRGIALPFDAAAAAHYAEIVAARERGGRPIGMADGQIAAICRANGARLATRNGRDFETTGVEVLDPWRHR